ncbi:HTH-type transcriptional regulator CynR [compost metagenome]
MDIDRVRYFHVFADTGSLVRASEVLNISQPALSKALRLLATEVGLELIEPDGRGLKLTPAGKSFQKETAALLRQWLDLPKKLQMEETWTPTRIGSFEVFTTYFLGHLVDYVELDSLEIHEFGPGRLEQALADDHIDIGITYVPVPKAGVDFMEVTKIRMGLFSRGDVFKNLEFSELPFVTPLLPAGGTPSKVMGLDGWPDHRFERKVKYRVTVMESALELCRKGLCVAYLPEFVVHLHNEHVKAEYRLHEVKSPLPQKERLQSVYLVDRKGSQETPLHRQIAKCLRSLK